MFSIPVYTSDIPIYPTGTIHQLVVDDADLGKIVSFCILLYNKFVHEPTNLFLRKSTYIFIFF